MSNITEEVGTLEALVQRLMKEHRDFASQTGKLDESIACESPMYHEITKVFATLKEELTDHMLAEETEIFPEVSNRGLFNERISEIMQQHLDITAALDRMKFALHGKDLEELRSGFNELCAIMNLHFPAEEKEVFLLVL
ncbi:MAG: hemerythrin domain-containing protein [Nitrososphaerota archaeon]|nr:hemerythrin domain-containing protein [Nitrososphaerota archaeon]